MNATLSLHIFALIYLLSSVAPAADSTASAAEYYEQPLCGLLAAFAGVEAAGVKPKVSLNDLCERELIGELGSTTRQLEEAVALLGGHAQTIGNCTLNELTLVKRPAILHVSSGGPNTPVDHWILFLGVDGKGNALVAEPPSKVMPLGLAQLNAMWDGLAIVLSNDATNPPVSILLACMSVRLLSLLLLFGAALLCYSACYRCLGERATFLRTTIPIILTGAVCVCVIRNLTFPDSLFMTQAFREISSLASSELDFVISTTDVRAFMSRNPAEEEVILDTRMARDFRLGAIDGAISVPVNISQTDFLDRCSTMNKDSIVYLYCQSSRCNYSDIVARRMASHGFSNTVVIRDGYVAWKKLQDECRRNR